MYYAVFLFQQAGISETSSSLLANGLQGVVLNLFTFPNMYYMDKWGRRWPMIIGGVGMGISMLIIGVVMKTAGTHFNRHAPSLVARLKPPLSQRKPRLRLRHQEDKFRLCLTSSITGCHCLCLHLRRRLCHHLGVCGVGVSARDILHEHAWSGHVHDDSHQLDHCMS